jgi:hypothetical protein
MNAHDDGHRFDSSLMLLRTWDGINGCSRLNLSCLVDYCCRFYNCRHHFLLPQVKCSLVSIEIAKCFIFDLELYSSPFSLLLRLAVHVGGTGDSCQPPLDIMVDLHPRLGREGDCC